MDKEKILKSAIEKWGIVSQLDMMVEESSELIQAINKLKRSGLIGGTNNIDAMGLRYDYVVVPNETMTIKNVMIYNNICSEIADVKIMLAQMELIFDKPTIDLIYERKIDRLKNRLKL